MGLFEKSPRTLVIQQFVYGRDVESVKIKKCGKRKKREKLTKNKN